APHAADIEKPALAGLDVRACLGIADIDLEPWRDTADIDARPRVIDVADDAVGDRLRHAPPADGADVEGPLRRGNADAGAPEAYMMLFRRIDLRQQGGGAEADDRAPGDADAYSHIPEARGREFRLQHKGA